MTSALDFAQRASLVLLIALAACALLRHRSASLRHAVLAAALPAVWLIPLVAALLPPLPLPLPIAADVSSVSPPLPTAADQRTTTLRPAEAPVVEDVVPSRWATWIAGLWAAGSTLGFGLLLAAVARLALSTRRARPVNDDRWRGAATRVAAEMQVTRPVQLRRVPNRQLLAVWGWRRPTLLLPECALQWTDERIETVLRHELAHIRRGDWLVSLHAAVLRAALWWNPLAWLACRRLASESERACDDLVLAQGVRPSTYAEHLVAIARALQPTGVAPAIPMASPSTLNRRIAAMLNTRLDRTTPPRLTRALLVAATVVLVLPLALLRAEQGAQTLQGVVYDPSGAVLPGVTLVLETGEAKAEAVTDAAGQFAFPNVGLGQHVLEAKMPGFHAYRQDLDLQRDGDWERAVTLPMGRLQEQIRVSAKRVTPAADQPAGPTPVRVGGNVKPPRKLMDVRPVYPAAMRDAGREGQVKIDAVIGQDGRVVAAHVTSPDIHPDFAVSAVDAVKQWVFSPTLLNGKPVDVVMTVSVAFTLE